MKGSRSKRSTPSTRAQHKAAFRQRTQKKQQSALSQLSNNALGRALHHTSAISPAGRNFAQDNTHRALHHTSGLYENRHFAPQLKPLARSQVAHVGESAAARAFSSLAGMSFSNLSAGLASMGRTNRKPVTSASSRQFSVLMGEQERILVECDPRFVDDEVISLFNPRTKKMEPVIVAVPESSFEFIYASPVDLHTFDVIPVAKECIDVNDPVYESQGK